MYIYIYNLGMTNIIRSISYKHSRCHFQEDLKKDIATVRNEDRIFVKADKSTNFYKLDTNQYNHLLNANVTKTYKKADKSKLDKIDKEAKNIMTKLDLEDCVELMATKEAFITLKDHKENFANRPACHLINPLSLPTPLRGNLFVYGHVTQKHFCLGRVCYCERG